MKNFTTLLILSAFFIGSITAQVPTKTGWSLISIPVNVPDGRNAILFPNAVSLAYAYQDGYIIKDTLLNGIGYWLKFLEDGNIPLYGEEIFIDTCAVKQGWNMIGSISFPVVVNTIISEPSEIITSKYFEYTPGVGYEEADTIQPGKGYWVKGKQNGSIILAPPPVAPNLCSPVNGSPNVFIPPTLTWNASRGATSYTLQVSTSNWFSSYTYNQNGITDTSQQVSGLNNGTTYYWRVSATNSFGTSCWSSPTWSFTTTNSCPGTPTVIYAGKTYNTVQIGNQCWLKENLDVGTRINGSYYPTADTVIEKYCYNDDPNNCDTYGGLYQWDEAMQYSTTEGTQGICPSGWHIPTSSEFYDLQYTVNWDGNALKVAGLGIGEGIGTNTSGFSALPTGYYNYGLFYSLGYSAGFWSSTEEYGDARNADNLSLSYAVRGIGIGGQRKYLGFSVRCIKD
jgi:uncharacterized protein (TIGR02145 family)